MIVLDTRALIWWVNGDEQLSDRARKAIEEEISSEMNRCLSRRSRPGRSLYW